MKIKPNAFTKTGFKILKEVLKSQESLTPYKPTAKIKRTKS